MESRYARGIAWRNALRYVAEMMTAGAENVQLLDLVVVKSSNEDRSRG